MKQYIGEINSLDDLNEITKTAQSNPIKQSDRVQFYRGHGSCCYKLVAFAPRFFKDKARIRENEKHLMSDLKRMIFEADKKEFIHVPMKPNEFSEDWYWLTQAQHLGIPTRFLDWSLSGEVALYFAVSKKTEKNEDGDFWVFFIPDYLNINNQQNLSKIIALETEQDFFVNIPIQWNMNFEKNQAQRNMLSQQGKFFLRPVENSLTPLEDEPIYENFLFRYKIPAMSKKRILNELNEINYTKKNIYKTTDRTMKNIVEKLIKTYGQRINK